MARWFVTLVCLLSGVIGSAGALRAAAPARLRVIVETDLGGDADDQASLVRFLLYSCEWDVEGIVADRPAEAFDVDPVRDHLGLEARDGWELAQRYLDAYANVYGNLVKHRPEYPPPNELRRRTVPGWNGTDAGVRLILKAADRDDPRPIWYGNWGSNSGAVSNLRRAFDHAKATRTQGEYERLVQKFRIVTLDGDGPTKQGHDDLLALHVETGYPTLDGGRWYHRFRPLTERAGGFDVRRDVKENHGPLGALYTTPKEGDSWTFVYLIPNGLGDPKQPNWGGWAGRYGPRGGDPLNVKGPSGPQFYWANQRDDWRGAMNRDNTAARWATHMQNDFKSRLDWCVAEEFADANHPPVPHCQGDATASVLQVAAPVGSRVALDARGSTDPDGDELFYRWSIYPEPGTYRGEAPIRNAESQIAELTIPRDAAGKTIHLILEVTDDGEPPLTRYRRIVVTGSD